MLLIPAIDLRHGRCVRLHQGDFGAETRYEHEPHELLLRYRSLGASWLHVVDLDGAKDGVLANRAVIVALASQRAVRLQVGGGVRSAAVVDDLLRHGVERVVVGSAAVERPEEVAEWLARFGAERICVALDVRMDCGGMPRVRTRGWTEGTALTLWEAVRQFPRGAVQHVLCTDIARDGMLKGINWDTTIALAEAVSIPVIASGGLASIDDVKAMLEPRAAKLEGAIAGRALYDGRLNAAEALAMIAQKKRPS